MGNEVITLRGQKHVSWECRTCGVISTCPEVVWDRQQAEGGFHFCSNGHQWGWTGETCEREKLRRERDQLKQRMAMLEDEKRLERERADKAEAATKRLKKRTAAGTCPCCQRTFSNMNTHMRKQHPAFVAEQTENIVPMKRA